MAFLHLLLRRFTISSLLLAVAITAHATGAVTTHSASKAGSNKPAVSKARLGWRELTPTQQQTLAPLASEWDELSTFRRKKWLELADRYARMSPAAQARMQTQMRDWAALSPEQRRKVRQNYLNSKKLSAQQKAAQWERYQQLPEERKRKLAASVPAKKTIVNPPLMHNRREPASRVPAPLPAPVLPAADQAAPSATGLTPASPSSAPDGDNAP